MKRPDVFMPLYIGDYLAGTSRLTTEQHGAYLLLIMDYWMNGPLPDDDTVLANIAKLTPDAWSMHGALLKHFFSIENGMLVHKRIEEELAKARAQKEKAAAKAKKAAQARWENKQNIDSDATSNATSTAQAMHKECPSPSPSPINNSSSETKNEESSKRKKTFTEDDLECAEWMYITLREDVPNFKKPNLETWADDIRKMRKLDKRDELQIQQVWTWARGDSFWSSNILSPRKLRTQFDQLSLRMTDSKPKPVNTQSKLPDFVL